MTFGDGGCNWDYILRREVLGPFAPRSGWIAALKRDSLSRGRDLRTNAILNTVACAILNRSMPQSRMARALKRQRSSKVQLELKEIERVERQRNSVLQQQKAESKFKYGEICRIVSGSRVRKLRRSSEFAIDLPQLLTLGSGIRLEPRCRSCNCRHCRRRKAG